MFETNLIAAIRFASLVNFMEKLKEDIRNKNNYYAILMS